MSREEKPELNPLRLQAIAAQLNQINPLYQRYLKCTDGKGEVRWALSNWNVQLFQAERSKFDRLVFLFWNQASKKYFSSEMNWYPNPTQLLGLNLNGYTNLTLQSHMAQRGLNLPFQLNQFQGNPIV